MRAYLERTSLYGGLPDFCAVNVVIDTRYTNLAATKQDGLDGSLSFADMVGDVFLNASVSASVVFHNKEQVIITEDFVDRLGYYSTPIKWRGRGSLGANYEGFSANLFANYTGSYINDPGGGPAQQQHRRCEDRSLRHLRPYAGLRFRL